MNIHHQNLLTSLASNSDSFFKNTIASKLIDQQKKIFAIAILAIGLFVISILLFIKREWHLEKMTDKNAKVISKTKTFEISDHNHNVNQKIIKAKQVAKLIKTQATAEALSIKAEAEAAAQKIRKEAQSFKAEAQSFNDNIKALLNKAKNNSNENKKVIKVESIPESNFLESFHPKIAFGQEQWAKYFGDIGNNPPSLPKDIHEILKSPCPFFSGKKVEETHVLVLIPEIINGQPLNLETLGELVKTPKNSHGSQYKNLCDSITKTIGQQVTTQSHWVLMTKDVIEGSKKKSYSEQKKLIAEVNRQKKLNYEIPNALDAAICIFMHQVSSQKHLFNIQPCTYTRCQENIEGYQVIVGGFSFSGLDVRTFQNDHDYVVGVAALRKFF